MKTFIEYLEERYRDYKHEYNLQVQNMGKPVMSQKRSGHYKARKAVGLKAGDPREADHKVMRKNGGSHDKENIRAVSRATNRRRKHTDI